MTSDQGGRAHTPPIKGIGDLSKLSLAALGIVYGDIGTSPLYAVKECFGADYGLHATHANVLGILSLVFWALTLVVVLKYLSLVMRADNHGEGGILALLALVLPRDETPKHTRRTALLLFGGLFGAALLYGDGVITPAISVLSAVEGLGVATAAFHPVIVPVTVAILVALFLIQRKGTAGIGAIFGPAMLVWFAALAALGLPQIWANPSVLAAINPLHAVRFLQHHGAGGFLVLGAVVLVITGGEALYADMGHFGPRPIRAAWYTIVMPALLINYFGQGALILARGEEVAHNPFYSLAPRWALYPMVVIATTAAIIASQALISGAFSLTQQAVQLGYWPRVKIVHTSEAAAGQIYIPEINWVLMLACVALVLGFRSSSDLAAAYGIAVTGTMGITSVLFGAVAHRRWGWSHLKAALVVVPLLALDLAFFSANLPKIAAGGWFPLVVAAIVFSIMTTWRRGRSELAERLQVGALPLELFLADVKENPPHRVAGTAVFMASVSGVAPQVLLHHLKHNKMLHEQVVLLSVSSADVPFVDDEDQVTVEALGEGFFRVTACYGFMQSPDVRGALTRTADRGLRIEIEATSFYLGRETLRITGKSRMARWRLFLFAFLSRNARAATDFFGLPANRVVELGAQIEV